MTENSRQDLNVDPLTGLLSRLGLQLLLSELDNNSQTDLALFSVQISRFGSINSSLGAAFGDRVIVVTANRLRKVFPKATAVARTHGDHFCLLFSGVVNKEDIINRLDDFTRRPLAIEGNVVVLSVRIGLASIGEDVPKPSVLLNASETALHASKSLNSHVSVYTASMDEVARATHAMENKLRVSMVNRHFELHRALANEEFELFYQPIIDLRSKDIHAFEALVRWRHPEEGMISPAKFIPGAEDIGVMDVLGAWILERAIHDAAAWPLSPSGQPISVSINISPKQFFEPSFLVSTLERSLRETQIPSELVKLEITESSAFVSTMAETLRDFKALGCKVSLDDFGTGYSSLTQLHQLTLDYLKLDRSFIFDLDSDDVEASHRSVTLTKAIFSLAETFGLLAVVEGVETLSQLQKIEDFGIPLAQGYYFAMPMPATRVTEYIKTFKMELTA